MVKKILFFVFLALLVVTKAESDSERGVTINFDCTYENSKCEDLTLNAKKDGSIIGFLKGGKGKVFYFTDDKEFWVYVEDGWFLFVRDYPDLKIIGDNCTLKIHFVWYIYGVDIKEYGVRCN